ncbi:hypothetical protein H4R33_000214 [Dimargaris cristalligena]|uniref:Zinc-binding dehydrogenase n=1 Tax=Dimargaris cristalligena TaxID=215637 RepID=A0A4P9ZY47_9FUNG|nr:hypothetical protein H4R33_000214 [Dimargaris cristalligena]RKP38616.1 zinc-binding dehydrogenase [Dimargaris cristalligena]|eukprot:RKP38616.1 zinc-binding dehydrogenase [Dimargaris cristalligena]
MQALVVRDQWLKSTSELKVNANVPIPTLKPGQVLVKVMAVGTNFFDILMVQGKYQIKPPRPFTPGCEFAGVVVKTHPNVSHINVGTAVMGSDSWGAYAEYLAVPAKQVIPKPDALSYEEACGLTITYPTSYAGLVYRGGLKRGDHVLIHAAAGGVGLAAVQIAKLLGATVIATVGSDAKADIVRAQGADHVVNYRDENWPSAVAKLTPQGRGVDIVYDPVGLIERSLKCTAWNGRLIVVGFAAGQIEKVAVNRVLLKNVSIVGLHWGAYLRFEPERVPEVWGVLLPWLAQRQLKPVVFPRVFHGLDQVGSALDTIASRESYGKVVVKVADPASAKL